MTSVFQGLSLSRSVGRVGENPGNEVGLNPEGDQFGRGSGFLTPNEGGVGIFGFAKFLGRFFGFCTEKLLFLGFAVRCSFRFFGFLASGFLAKIK